MKNLGGLEYEFCIAVSIEGHMQCFFSKPGSGLGVKFIFRVYQKYCIGVCFLVLLPKCMNCIFDAFFGHGIIGILI